MLAEKPSLLLAIEAVREFANRRKELSPESIQALLEVERRLERLEGQAAELIEINNKLWDKEDFSVDLDPDSDTLTFSVKGKKRSLKLKRADPNVPLQIRGMTTVSAYHAGTAEPRDEEERALRIQLEEKIESYYQSAHRIIKLIEGVPGIGEIAHRHPIRLVRNKLVEHPEKGAPYSFGVGSTGPRVKPMHQGRPEFKDDGLVPNTTAFVTAIIAACQ